MIWDLLIQHEAKWSMQVTTWKILIHGGLVAMLSAVPMPKWCALIKLGDYLDAQKADFFKACISTNKGILQSFSPPDVLKDFHH